MRRVLGMADFIRPERGQDRRPWNRRARHRQHRGKAGLFAKVFALLLAAKKLIIFDIAAAGEIITKLFRRTAI
ncbi:MAG: hypothetical protein ABIS07_09500 [Dokdonella sp.]